MTESPTFYRVHRSLSNPSCGIEYAKGELTALDGITQKGIQKLLKRGAITEAVMPPLSVVVYDLELVEILSEGGITKVEQLLSMDVKELAMELMLEEEVLNKLISKVHKFLEPNKSARYRR